MIRFGPWSIFLAVLAGQALLLAVALARTAANRRANRLLALLLVVIAGMLVPFIIGYAGFYDAYPWLSYAPFAVPLAVGPLLYAHVHALALGGPISRWHFAPPIAQFLYQAACFPLPLATKHAIVAGFDEPWLSPVLTVAIPLSMATYGALGWRLARRYAIWARSQATGAARSRRLAGALAALLILFAARVGYTFWDIAVDRIDYFDLFGFYVLLALIGSWLGVEGWRQAATPFPPLPAPADHSALAATALARLRAGQDWRDPALSLEALARTLGTNASYLSRALNQAGGGFSEIVNGLRAEEVARRLDYGDEADLLTIALESGFGSKASFNRAFQARYGRSPSVYRGGADRENPQSAKD
jgi:AraC-like DNA-binding protein